MSHNQPDTTPLKNKNIQESDLKVMDSMSKVSLFEGYKFSNVQTLPSQIVDKSNSPFVNVLLKQDAPLKTVLSYAFNNCCALFLGFIALIVGSFANFAVPGLIGLVVTSMEKYDWQSVNIYCLYMLGIVIISGIGAGFRGAIFNTTSEQIARQIRYDLFYFLIRKDVAYFDETKTGEILSRLSTDTQIIQDGMSVNVSMFIRAMITVVISLVILFIISWKLTLITLAGVIPIVFFAMFFGFKVRDLSKIVQDVKAEIGQVSEEAISNIRTVKAFANELQEIKKFKAKNDKAFSLGKQLSIWQGVLTFFIQFTINGAMAGIIYYGAVLCSTGDITVGAITSFLLYMIQLIFNFAIIAGVFTNIFKMAGASQKIVSMMKHQPTVNAFGGSIIPDDQCVGEIELQNVSFYYPTKKDVMVARNISLKVQKNKFFALVGTSGCGKSSIISLVERFYDPIEGGVFFSGVNIKDLDPRWYKNQIAIVSQEPVLFSGTIKQNICYGLDVENITEKELEEACAKANALTFISDKQQFPQGFDTLVGERGIKLSGGQKQRVAIARALIRKPKVLLLDEATSALDAESEHLVQKAIDLLTQSGQQTVICIAHRLSTIRDADCILVMKEGQIVEKGTHNELIQNDGVYKSLIKRQLDGQKDNAIDLTDKKLKEE